jgi:hypothetical protein
MAQMMALAAGDSWTDNGAKCTAVRATRPGKGYLAAAMGVRSRRSPRALHPRQRARAAAAAARRRLIIS